MPKYRDVFHCQDLLRKLMFAGAVSLGLAACGGQTSDDDTHGTTLMAKSGSSASLPASQVNSRYAQMMQIVNSKLSDDAKLAKLVPFCSADFSLHGKNCEGGMREVILIGKTKLVTVAAFDMSAIDQYDTTVPPGEQNVATVARNNGYTFTWLWKKAGDGKYYMAGDGDKKALVMMYANAFDWGGAVLPSIFFDIRTNDDGTGNPVVDTAVITGPGLLAPVTIAARQASGLEMLKNATDPWWQLSGGVFNQDTSGLWGADDQPPFYDLAQVREGVRAKTPYVITLKKNDDIVAVYKQSLRVAPYQSDYAAHPNFDVAQPGGSTLTMENGSKAAFPKLANAPTLALGINGGTYTAKVVLPTGHERTSTAVISLDSSWAWAGFYDTVWAKAAAPISVSPVPTATTICVDVSTFDKFGHRFFTERCASQ
jgi:hypothetical protein